MSSPIESTQKANELLPGGTGAPVASGQLHCPVTVRFPSQAVEDPLDVRINFVSLVLLLILLPTSDGGNNRRAVASA